MLVKLKDIAKFINGRAYLMPELQKEGKYRIVRVGNFSGKDEWFYSDMELEPEKYCEKGDLLYKWACNFGPEIWKEEKAIYHYHIWKIIPDESKVNKFYLYYKLAIMTPYWLSSTNGSTMVHITKETMEEKLINLPNIETQNRIAKILMSIDAQIERNNAVVKRLQVLAQTIYKRWFIQFEYPFADGNLVWNTELNRKIPRDWKVINLGNLIRKVNIVDNNTINSPMIDLSVMPSSDVSLIELNSSEKFSTNLNEMIEGNILFGSIRPYLKKCGIAPCNGKVAGTVYQFEELKKESYNYALLTMSQNFFFDYALKVSKGTRMPVVSAEDLLSYKLPYNENIVNLFNRLPIKKVIISFNKMTRKLIFLKEKLLPLLINNQLG